MFNFILQTATNLIAVVLLYHAAAAGWVQKSFAADTTGLIVPSIAVVTIIALALAQYVGWWVAVEIRRAKSHSGYFSKFSGSLNWFDTLLFKRTSIIKTFSNFTMILGLIGTVVGMIMITDGLGFTDAMSVEAMVENISVLSEGIGVSLYTTLVGGVFGLLIDWNYALIRINAAKLKVMLSEDDISA